MRTLAATAALAFGLFVNSAQAADIDLSAGAAATVGVRWTEVAFFDASGGVYDWGAVHLQPTATVGWIGSRNDPQDHLGHQVWIAGAGARLVGWWRGAFVGFEGALTSQRTDALSSHAQFISSLGWQGDHYVLMVRHISNGDLFGGRNLGDTMLLVGLRF